jgi:putative ABC transport system permease protein
MLTRRKRPQRDFTAEIEAHLALEIDRFRQEGMSPADAEAAARRRFGNVSAAQERFYETGRWMWWEHAGSDLRSALRGLLRTPGFTAIAVLSLALGTGANTAIFSVINAVLLRPLPYRDANRIVVAWEKRQKEGTRTNGVTPADYLDWRVQNHGLSTLTAHEESTFLLTGVGDPQRVTAVLATPDMYETYGVAPILGRSLVSSDEHVALLSYAFWQSRFGGQQSVLNRTIRLDDQSYTVVGVLPADFRFYWGRPPDLCLPLRWTGTRSQDRGSHDLLVIGRLRPGITIGQAQEEFANISGRLERAWPATNTGHSANLVPIPEQLRDSVRPVLYILSGAVLLVLLIACANVANLVLARGMTRSREIAVREALGASRSRLIRLFLTESLLLSIFAGALGIALSFAGLQAVKPLLPKVSVGGSIPGIENIAIDGHVLLFTVIVSLLTGAAFGTAPAWQLARVNVNSGLKDGGRSGSASPGSLRMRNVLAIAETACACILLVGATLLFSSFLRLTQVNPGFQAVHRISMEIVMPGGIRNAERRIAVYRDMIDKVSALPGVRSVALTNYVPGNRGGWRWGLRTERQPEQRSIEDTLKIWMHLVSPGFLSTMGIPVVDGRGLTDQDSELTAPVVILSQTAARRYFPGESAVGKKIAFGDQQIWRTVVGIAGSIRHLGLDREPEAEVYVPFTQLSEFASGLSLVLHGSRDVAALSNTVRQTLVSINASIVVGKVDTIQGLIDNSTSSERFHTVLIGSFAGLALLLAVAGLYGVLSFLVSQHTREIGIRVALGARRSEVVAHFLIRAARLIVIGLGIGMVGALAASQLLKSYLFAVSPSSLFVYGIAGAMLMAAGLIAAFQPAFRAARVDPVVALRSE